MSEVNTPWMTVEEAAEYLRCSLRSFLRMRLPAHDSGGRKVYHRGSLDAAILARPWRRTEDPFPESLALQPVNDRLSTKRIRPYRPRKSATAQEHHLSRRDSPP